MDNNTALLEVQEIVEEISETVELTRDMLRSRRHRDVRSKTISIKRLSKRAIYEGKLMYPEDTKSLRPKTRAECLNAPRPCPFVSCTNHLYLDVSPRSGAIKINFPDVEVWEMKETCALDVADRGGVTLEEVSLSMNLTRERVRQVEVQGIAKIQASKSGTVLRDFIDESQLPAVGKRRLPMIAATVIEDDEDEDDGGMSGAPSQLALADWIKKIDRTHNEVTP